MSASTQPAQSPEQMTDSQRSPSQRDIVRARAQQHTLISHRALASLVATLLFSMVIVFAFAAIAHAHGPGGGRSVAPAESSPMSFVLPLVAGAISGAIVVWLKRPGGARRR